MPHLHTEKNPYIHNTRIKGVFFDNDGTLYAASEDILAAQEKAAIETIKHFHPRMSARIIKEKMQESQKRYGGSLDIFARKDKRGPDLDTLRENYYQRLIAYVDKNNLFRNDPGLKESLATLRQTLEREPIIITHGSPVWTNYSIAEIGIISQFNTRAHVCKDHVPGHKGKEADRIYHIGLDRAGVSRDIPNHSRGEGYAMVDDSVGNLRQAKETGMITILIKTGNFDMTKIPDYVDVVVRSIHEANQVVITSNQHHIAQQNRVEPDSLHNV